MTARTDSGLHCSGLSVERDGVPILHGVDLAVPAGGWVSLVGPNGSGKSTILKLAVRLYDPSAGTILLGGHDVRTLRLADLRAAIAVLFQDYTHFPLSIRDNIALGDPAHFRDDAHVRAAARLGGAAGCLFAVRAPFNVSWEEDIRQPADRGGRERAHRSPIAVGASPPGSSPRPTVALKTSVEFLQS